MYKLYMYYTKTLCLRKQLRQAKQQTDDIVAQELSNLEAIEVVKKEFLSTKESSRVNASSPSFPFSDIIEMLADNQALISSDSSFGQSDFASRTVVEASSSS